MTLNSWGLKLVIVAGIVLLIAAVIRILTPQEPTLPAPQLLMTNVDGTTSKFGNIIYSGSFVEIPKTLPVVLGVRNPELTQKAIDQLASNLGLTQHPETSEIFRGPDWLLNIIPALRQATLTTTKTSPPEGTVNRDQSLQVATAFVNTYLPNTGLKVAESGVKYLDASTEVVEVNDISQANAIQIPFTYLVQNVPIFFYYDSDYPLTVFTNRQNEIIRVVLSSNLGQITPTEETIPTIPLEKALENLNQLSQGSVLANNYHGVREVNLRSITRGTMTSAQLEYRVDSNLQLAYPVYRLKGTLVDNQNIAFEGEIIVPAVNIK